MSPSQPPDPHPSPHDEPPDRKALARALFRPRTMHVGEALCTILGVQYDNSIDDDDLLRRSRRDSMRALSLYLGRRLSPIYDPAQAWAALVASGVFLDGWPSDSRRRFAGRCMDCVKAYDACARCTAAGERWPHPPRVRAAVTLAADPAGVARAEALAREARARWQLWWDVRVDDTVTWRVLHKARICESTCMSVPGLWAANGLTYGQNSAREQIIRELCDLRPDLCDPADWYVAFLRVGDLLFDQARYHALAAEGREPFASRPDPFAPQIALLELGYAMGQQHAQPLELLALEL